jgi:hypothetical protein
MDETEMPIVLTIGCDEGLGRGVEEAYAADGWGRHGNLSRRRQLPGRGRRYQAPAAGRDATFRFRRAQGEKRRCAHRRPDLQRGDCDIDSMRPGAIDYEFAARILDVNTIGPLRLAEAFVDNIAASTHRKIALITSRMGSIGSSLARGRRDRLPETNDMQRTHCGTAPNSAMSSA